MKPLSETWLNEEQAAIVELEGYKKFHINRNTRKGGGVALYIDRNYNSKLVSKMSIAIDNIMECITVEMEIEKLKKITTSCVCRTAGSCINTFRKKLLDLYADTDNKIMLFVCGDFNIDLSNTFENNPTAEFINTMYTMSLYPSITRPTRITTHSATLIGNIFTSVIDRKIVCGLLINDISDHLPVFITLQSSTRTKKDSKTTILTGHKTKAAMNSLRNDLTHQNWNKVYVEDDDEGCESFLSTITALYEKKKSSNEESSKANICFTTFFIRGPLSL